MGSSSGNSWSMTTLIQNSGSESDFRQQHLIDERKRKRKQSNRESARRSRMRKQKHLDDLTTQVADLRKENGQIVVSISVTTQHYVSLEAENSILKAQLTELNQRLESLNEILGFIEASGSGHNGGDSGCGSSDGDGDGNCEGFGGFGIEAGHQGVMENNVGGLGEYFVNPFNLGFFNQPIMANADIFYC